MLVNICKYIIHGPSGMDYGGPVWKRVLKPIQWCFGSWPKIPWRRWSEQRIYPHSHDLFEPKNYNHNFPTTWQIMILSVPDALWTAIDVWLFVCIYLFCFLFTNMFFFFLYSTAIECTTNFAQNWWFVVGLIFGFTTCYTIVNGESYVPLY